MAFGNYLADLIHDNPWNQQPLFVELVRAVHGFEMAIAENTARCRAAVAAGQTPPKVEKYTSGMVKTIFGVAAVPGVYYRFHSTWTKR